MQAKVTIVLSVFQPNETFLRKQLLSLVSQTYKNIEVLVYDDGVRQRCDVNMFTKYLQGVKWQLLPYRDKNIGYVKAFETLIKASDGAYIAFCDQDDIWHDEKIERCVRELQNRGSLLVATDRMIIDQDDKVITDSVRACSHKPWDTWESGDDIGKYNLFITYAVGMSIVLNADFARRMIPISKYAAHDNWAILCACAEGSVSFLKEPLVSYRRHGKNVSGVLLGIHSKHDYMEQRVYPHVGIVKDFKAKYPQHKDLPELEAFTEARVRHNIRKIFKYRYLAKDVAYFDIAVALLPNVMFPLFVKIVQKLRA